MTEVIGAVAGLLIGAVLVLWWRGQAAFSRCGRKPRGLSIRVNRAGVVPIPWRMRLCRLQIPAYGLTFREWFIPLPFNGVACVCWVPLRWPDESHIVPDPTDTLTPEVKP